MPNGAFQRMVATGDHILLAGGSAGAGTALVSFATSTGAVEWQAQDCVRPIIVRQRAIAHCTVPGPDWEHFGVEHPAGLVAFRLSDAHVLWSRPDVGEARGDNATISGTDIYADTNDGLVDINPVDGTTRWAVPLSGEVLAVDNTRVYQHCGAEICAVLRSNGSLSWSVCCGSSLAAAGGLLYTSDGGVLRASDGSNVRNMNFHTRPAIADGHLIVTDGPRITDIYGLPGG
jgi:hypothetical protein